jgi:predicted alpha/beta superfamily hydrolase
MRRLSIPSGLVTAAVIALIAGVGVLVFSSKGGGSGLADRLSNLPEDTFNPMKPLALPQARPEAGIVPSEHYPAGVTLIVKDDSSQASSTLPIFIACNRNNWNPADPNWKMTFDESDRLWRLTLPPPSPAELERRFEFKLTLGSWERAEVDSSGFSIRNRSLPLVDITSLSAGRRPTVQLSVTRFVNEGEVENLGLGWIPRVSSGRVEAVRVKGGAGRAKNLTRDVWVWLPKEYDQPAFDKGQFSVLWILDGQNVFETNAVTQAEWRIDESLSKLITEGKVPPTVVIAIPHAGRYRFDEYWSIGPLLAPPSGPYADAQQGMQADPDGFLKFVIDVVQPAVAQRFRISSAPENNTFAGGEVAGNFAYFAASRRPDVFGSALVENLSFPYNGGVDPRYLDAFFKGHPAPRALSVGWGDIMGFQDSMIGTVPADWISNDIDFLRKAMNSRVTKAPERLLLNFQRNTDNSERGWAERFPNAAEFHFAPLAKQPVPDSQAKPSKG